MRLFLFCFLILCGGGFMRVEFDSMIEMPFLLRLLNF